MNRVGILTIHKLFNYGSLLQSFATKRAIECLGYESQIIDYLYPNSAHLHHLALQTRAIQAAFTYGNRTLKRLLPGNPYRRYIDRYRRARAVWLGSMSSLYESQDDIAKEPPIYEVYLIGSDQLWHPRSVLHDKTFFGSFVPRGKVKLSYGSSFGVVAIPESLKQYYAENLDSFDRLSVREKSGACLIRTLTGRDPKVVLDPTLLFDAEFWGNEAADFEPNNSYIVCYGSNPGSRYMERLAVSIAKRNGWSVIRINGTGLDYFRRSLDYKLDVGPREWLGIIRNARMVLAQSFHATAFAVNFEVPFLSILRGEPNHDARQKEFLEAVGLSKQIVLPEESLEGILPRLENMDFGAVRVKLGQQRAASWEFLRSSLAGEDPNGKV